MNKITISLIYRALLFLVVLVMAICVATVSVDAESATTKGMVTTRTVSEYDMIKSLQSKTDLQLTQGGYSKKEIKQIRTVTQAKEKYGKVTYTVSYSKMKYKKGVTYLTTKTTWSWSKKPVFALKDIIGMTTSSAFTKDKGSTKVVYYLYGNKNKKREVTSQKVKTNGAGTGTFIRIKVGKEYDKEAKTYRKIALSGSMTVTWSVNGKIRQTGIASNYGHSVLSLTPSVSFSATGVSMGFTPSISCLSGDEAYKKAKL